MNTVSFSHYFLPERYTRKKGHSAFPKRGMLTMMLVIGATWPLMLWFAKRVNDGGDEPWGLIPLLVALGFLWREWRQGNAPWQLSSLRSCAGAMVLLATALSTLHLPPLLRAMMAIFGVCLLIGLRRHAAIALLLLLSLPVISSLQFYAGWPLRLLVSEGAVVLLKLLGFSAKAQQAMIYLEQHAIAVDPACSGIRFLWHGCVVAAWIAAWRGVSARATLLMLLTTVALVLAANVLRACLLCFQQTGQLPAGEMVHELLGLLCFGLALWPLLRIRWEKVSGATKKAGEVRLLWRRITQGTLCAAALTATLLGMLKPWVQLRDPLLEEGTRAFVFQGTTMNLVALPLDRLELVFAADFPGKIGVYAQDGAQVILRDVTCATRKLHPSRDCLRAGGFALGESKDVTREGELWSCYTAARDGVSYDVYERIVSTKDGSVWTDVSAWFWNALRHPLNGPWRAETVMLPKGMKL